MKRLTPYIKASAVQAAAWMPDAMMIGGAGAISYGVGLVYPPAGYVVGGLLAVAAGWIVARSGK